MIVTVQLNICKQVVAKHRSQEVECALELRRELESSRLSAKSTLQGFEGEFRQLQQDLLHDVADLKERILVMKANIRGTLKSLDFSVAQDGSPTFNSRSS